MSLTLADVHRIAHLARIEITDEQATAAAAQLNDIFAMYRADRPGRHDRGGADDPPAGRGAAAAAGRGRGAAGRDELLRNAPAQEDGLFLVPRVIE